MTQTAAATTQTAAPAATVEAAVETVVQTKDSIQQCNILDPSAVEAAQHYREQFAKVLEDQRAQHEAEHSERTDAYGRDRCYACTHCRMPSHQAMNSPFMALSILLSIYVPTN